MISDVCFPRCVVVVVVVIQLCCCVLINGSKVLLISMDGFRWDYVNQVGTPNFDDFAANGTRADYINSTFVTKTFPSHYSMVTGLYEESHGIIGNSMYDPEFGETFNKGTKDTRWWDGGEPLWVTTRKHGLKSAVFFWPGSESVIRGLRPNIYQTYNKRVSVQTRVETVVQWLSNDIDLALLYFHEPDSTGHQFGPNSPQVKATVREMDLVLGYIVHKLDKANLTDKVNVIVTSDHGMTEIDYAKRHIDLSEYIDMNMIEYIPTTGPTANILPKRNMNDVIYQNLSGIPHLRVYHRESIPDHWHYSNHRRILPIFAVADEGWVIVKGPEYYDNLERGTHGYDNFLSSMKPIFYARGPNIRSGYKTDPFNVVDLYPLICELLCIPPAPNNGTLDNTAAFIVYNTSKPCPVGTSGAPTTGVPEMILIFCLLITKELHVLL